jgi:hypothetical protein
MGVISFCYILQMPFLSPCTHDHHCQPQGMALCGFLDHIGVEPQTKGHHGGQRFSPGSIVLLIVTGPNLPGNLSLIKDDVCAV